MEAKLAHVVELSSDTHTRQDFIIIPRLFFLRVKTTGGGVKAGISISLTVDR